MSTPNKQLIAAIQRIAEGSPLFTEVRGLLREIQRRGGIEGLSLKIGADDESGGDCCTNPNETGAPSESAAPDISGDAPPDMSGGTPEGWSDCETGEPITFTPAGFVQPETCKECGPDPDWQQGIYYQWNWSAPFGPPATSVLPFKGAEPTFNAAKGEMYAQYAAYLDYRKYTWRNLQMGSFPSYSYERYTLAGWVKNSGNGSGGYINCGSIQADYCPDVAPEVCGDNWESDSTTNYTLINGCMVASSCDPDATEQAKQCNEQIIICDENGNERIIQSIGNGQFIMYDPSDEYKGGRYNSATGERLEILDPGSNGGYGSIS